MQVTALDHLTMGAQTQAFEWQGKRFDLDRYREHLKRWIGEAAVSFDDLPQLRIRRISGGQPRSNGMVQFP